MLLSKCEMKPTGQEGRRMDKGTARRGADRGAAQRTQSEPPQKRSRVVPRAPRPLGCSRDTPLLPNSPSFLSPTSWPPPSRCRGTQTAWGWERRNPAPPSEKTTFCAKLKTPFHKRKELFRAMQYTNHHTSPGGER